MKEDVNTRRSYSSPLRKRQQQQTRESILEALQLELIRRGPTALSINEVAEQAGVSVRTLYRHFGSREQLLIALQDHAGRQRMPPLPTDLAALEAYPEPLFAAFDAHATWVEAMLKVESAGEMRRVGKEERLEAFRRLLEPLVRGMPEDEAIGVVAVVKQLVSADAWYGMRTDFGLDGPAAGRAVSRALRALLSQLASERDQRSRKEGEREEPV